MLWGMRTEVRALRGTCPFPPALILPAQGHCLQPGYLPRGLTQDQSLSPPAPCTSHPVFPKVL